MIAAIKNFMKRTSDPAEGTNNTTPAADEPSAPQAAAPIEQLRAALGRAKDGLGQALRALIASGIQHAEHGRLENAFENAKNALAATPTVAHLSNAVQELKLAVNILSNHSLKNGSDLTDVKEALSAAEGAATRLKPSDQ